MEVGSLWVEEDVETQRGDRLWPWPLKHILGGKALFGHLPRLCPDWQLGAFAFL